MRFKHIAAVLGSCALIISTPAYALPEEAAEPTRPAVAREGAQAALDRVQELFAAKPTKGLQRATEAVGHVDATLALRDLRAHMDALPEKERKIAERYLMRPNGGGAAFGVAWVAPYVEAQVCGEHICVHYVTAESGTGENVTTAPQAAVALAELESVWTRIVDLGGYKAPKSDIDSANNGGDLNPVEAAKFDVYLANIGDNGLYGFCTSDDPSIPPLGTISGLNANRGLEVSAYCVLDNNYAEYGADPLSVLRVTAAHEFFHAVQYAYDWMEDTWFMEGTAAWIEDELFDSVNDNRQYLQGQSPLTNPWVPLDFSVPTQANYYNPYGSWIFWRFLSERYAASTGELPNIIREIWTRADGPLVYSSRAVDNELKERRTSFGEVFRVFGAKNRFPGKAYEEGRAYKAAWLAKTYRLRGDKRTVAWQRVLQSHMSNTTVRFKPKSSLRGRWRITITVDAPPKARGSFASVAVHKKTGKIVLSKVSLNRKGNGTKRVLFGTGPVKHVELTLTNASLRSKCWQWQTYMSCAGNPKDEQLPFFFKAKVSR